MERDKSQIVALEVTINFNSHAHVERDFQARQQRLHQGNFNSHAHVERDKININKYLCEAISTHTLTWSVTNEQPTADVQEVISTHTLTWSVTLDVVYIWCLLNVMRTYFFI